MNDELETTAVEIEPVDGEHLPAVAHDSTLFRSDDPATVLQRAQDTADALMPVVRNRGLITRIGDRDHLQVEAWQTLGAMLGVTPVNVWTRRLDESDPTGAGWEARVDARTLDGRVIGAAEAMCLRSEEQWDKRRGETVDEFALRSMAQTRATSKALASVLRFVAVLGGASGTPAEEMPDGGAGGGTRARNEPSSKQIALIEKLIGEAGGSPDTVNAIVLYARNVLTAGREGTASSTIDALMTKETRKATAIQLATDANEWASKQSDVPGDTAGLDE